MSNMNRTPTVTRHDDDAGDPIARQLLLGFGVLAVLVGGVGLWAWKAPLTGAVLAPGTVVVDSSVKKVQHPTGGVVGSIRVKDGDRVTAGDVLIRLDETMMRANLGVITRQLDELAIRQARLGTERDGVGSVAVPASLARRMGEPEVARMVSSEQLLFSTRRTARDGQRAQLRERIAQLTQEIRGFEGQRQGKTGELGLIRREIAALEVLWKRELVTMTKYHAIHREAKRLEGERGQLGAQVAQARGKIAEIELQIIQLDQDMRSEVMKELRDAQAREAELSERRVAAEDQLSRAEIRAPQTGVVHQLAVHTVGGVVTPSEPVMLIVPDDDALVVEAKVAPQDIDHVHARQHARVRFTAFDQRTTPEFEGEVRRIGADLSREPQTGQPYYVVRVSVPQGASGRTNDLRLIPGMPAEVHITTGERTALSYLLKPLRDQVAKAFTER